MGEDQRGTVQWLTLQIVAGWKGLHYQAQGEEGGARGKDQRHLFCGCRASVLSGTGWISVIGSVLTDTTLLLSCYPKVSAGGRASVQIRPEEFSMFAPDLL